MKKATILMLITAIVLITACKKQTPKTDDTMNPFLQAYDTPFGIPPFDRIKLTHYLPAIEEGIKQANKEIEAIIKNQEKPNFENTILALDHSGKLIDKVTLVFYPLNSAVTNDSMQALARKINPLLTSHKDNVLMNKALFEKIKAVYDKKDDLRLDKSQKRVVDKYYQDFMRNGANLIDADQEKLRDINQKLSKLYIQFGENLLKETNKNFRLIIEDEKNLKGLPENVISAAAEQAEKDGMNGKWIFTLQKPSMIPFLQFAENRKLRERIYKGYYMRGDNNNEFDNKKTIQEIIRYRYEKAKLLDFEDFASYVIDKNMAKTPEKVYAFLQKIWKPALEVAKRERKEMQKIIDKENDNFKLAPWDWWYYTEKLRKQKYDLDEKELKPYFSLENSIKGVFYLVNKLYGLRFEKIDGAPTYHDEAMVYEVKEADGSHLGILFMDFHPRDGKRVGAWCTSFRDPVYKDGKRLPAISTIVMNFTRPSGNTPALLSFDEVTTFFHEFGHSLHGLFTDGLYKRTAGHVPRDFVEFPSQVMENWATAPEILKVYAKHYKTNETLPDKLIDKIEKSAKFNQGFEIVEYIAAALLDMDYHTLKQPEVGDVRAFEKQSMDNIGLISEIIPRYRSTYFQHVFRGEGYAAGYYVYLWSQVLDADAYKAFEETGDILNPELAKKFRTLLTKCGEDDGMVVYHNFRGKDPDINNLLVKRGLK